MTELSVITRAEQFRTSIALRTPSSQATYGDLLDRSAAVAGSLLCESADLQEARAWRSSFRGGRRLCLRAAGNLCGGVHLPLSLTAT